MTLVVVTSHPVQYHAPVYRAVQAQYNIPVVVIYESDFSVAGYYDKGFGVTFAWDTDLLSGYTPVFLSRVAEHNQSKTVSSIAPPSLAAKMREWSPRAILLQYYHGRFGWSAFRAALQAQAPLLFRAETTDQAISRSHIKSLLRRQYLHWFYSHFEVLLPIGSHSYAHYIKHGVPPGKLLFSPYCVDPTPFQCSDEDRDRVRAETRAELSLDEQTIVILFSGKLIPQKAPELLLAAADRIATNSEIAVVFLGDGEMRESLSGFSASHLTVEFLGFRNQSQMSRYYHASDLLVLPSKSGETWGLVVNEALHHGLPCVVSSAVGCAPDLIIPAQTGEVFLSEDVDALAIALKKALPLVRRSDIRQICRAQADRYSLHQAAAGIAEAYERVAKAG